MVRVIRLVAQRAEHLMTTEGRQPVGREDLFFDGRRVNQGRDQLLTIGEEKSSLGRVLFVVAPQLVRGHIQREFNESLPEGDDVSDLYLGGRIGVLLRWLSTFWP